MERVKARRGDEGWRGGERNGNREEVALSKDDEESRNGSRRVLKSRAEEELKYEDYSRTDNVRARARRRG